MRLIIQDNNHDACYWCACYVKQQILNFRLSNNRNFILGLPTGSTPLNMYKYLIQFHKKGELSFKYVTTFNMDEYVGLDEDDKGSYHYYMKHNFFDHIDINPDNINILNGNSKDLNKECELYENKINDYGGIDLMIGGLGQNGHVAFNDPGSSLSSVTRVKTLCSDTITINSQVFSSQKMPNIVLTIGIQTIMNSKDIVIIATGTSKAVAVEKCIENGVNHMWTGSIIQMHSKSCFVVDKFATSELKVKTVKYYSELQKSIDYMGNHINHICRKISKNDNILIFSPHPDDDILGTGGLLQHIHNNNVKVAYMTSGENGVKESYKLIRENEAESALISLGYKRENATFLKLPFYNRSDKSVTEKDIDICQKIIEEYNPQHVFICNDPDPNGTHEICFNIIRSSLMNLNIMPIIWCYKGAWGKLTNSEDIFILPFDEYEMGTKLLALSMHISQFPPKFPGKDGLPFDVMIKKNNTSQLFPGCYEERFKLIQDINKLTFT